MQNTKKNNDSKLKTRRRYNFLSPWYDLMTGSSETRLMKIGLDLLNPSKCERILEIGPGRGHGLVSLANGISPTGLVAGIDLSERMLSFTNRIIQKLSLQNRVLLTQGDASLLPYKTSSFSGIFLSFTIELFELHEIHSLLIECARVLTPGGRMVIIHLLDLDSFSVSLYKVLHSIFPNMIDCQPIKLEPFLEKTDFQVVKSQTFDLFSLPVGILLLNKIKSGRIE